MDDKPTNKFLSEILKIHLGIETDPERIFSNIIHEGRVYTITPSEAKNIYCPWCKSNKGVACDRQTWSCLNSECLQKNAKLSKKLEKIY